MKALTLVEIETRLASKGVKLAEAYSNTYTRTKFVCERGHSWITTPSKIIHSGTGCPHCSRCAPLSAEVINQRLTGRGIQMVGPYTSALAKGLFSCDNGHEWEAEVNSVVKGNGCPHCANRIPYTVEEVQNKLNASGIRIVGTYTTTHKKVEVECQEGHRWKVKPNALLQGHGCPECANKGFDPTKPGVLYLLELHGDTLTQPVYKIGVTNRSVTERAKQFVSGSKLTYTILESLLFEKGKEAIREETRIKQKNKHLRYESTVPGLQCGYTEMFTANVWDF